MGGAFFGDVASHRPVFACILLHPRAEPKGAYSGMPRRFMPYWELSFLCPPPPPEPRSEASSSSAMPWSLPWRPNTAASNSRMLRTSAERPTASRILAADSAAGAFEGLKLRLHCLGWVRGLLKHSYVLLLGLLRLAASLRSSLEFHLDCRACKHESAQHKHYILCRSGRIRSERPRSLNPRP